MNLEELRTEFLARGFDYLRPTSRADVFLNDAYQQDICEDEDWPFLEATATGAAPLTIADLRAVEFVIDTTLSRQLYPMKRGRIVDDLSVDLAQVGSPSVYYLTGGNTVNVHPAATDQLSVRYWKVPPRLGDTDTPLLPERFHSLVVDAAIVRAYEDSDDWELADTAEGKFHKRLARMRESLGMQQHDADDDFVVVTDPYAL